MAVTTSEATATARPTVTSIGANNIGLREQWPGPKRFLIVTVRAIADAPEAFFRIFRSAVGDRQLLGAKQRERTFYDAPERFALRNSSFWR